MLTERLFRVITGWEMEAAGCCHHIWQCGCAGFSGGAACLLDRQPLQAITTS